jgi:acetyl esterase/lipase
MTNYDRTNTELITCGRELPIDERFCYRALQSVTYKSTPQVDLELHIHLPHDWHPADRRPTIVFFFGGGLQEGTVEQFTRQGVYFAGKGMVTVRADYRVMPKYGITADRCVADAKSAIRWVRAHAGAWGIDPNRIVAAGGSSGGFLAAATGILPGLDEVDEDHAISSRPNLMVLFNPALDIHSRTELIVQDITPDLADILPRCLAPDEELARKLHIPSHLTTNAPPMWVWYGTADAIYQFAWGFIDQARALTCRMTLLLTEGALHGAYNDYRAPYLETLYSVEAFLSDQGYIA